MSRFGKYLGYMSIDLDGEKLEIKPTLRQKQQLMAIQQKSGKGGMSLEQWQELHIIFKDILRTVDSEATDDELEAFLLQHDIDFMMKLYVAFGWLKEEDIDGLKGELKKKAMESN
jgi:hypothetical protein